MIWAIRNPFLRHVLVLGIGIVSLLLVTICLLEQTDAAYRRRLRMIRSRRIAREDKPKEYEDEFTGEAAINVEMAAPVWHDEALAAISKAPPPPPPIDRSTGESKSADVTESFADCLTEHTGSLLTLFTTMKNTSNRSRIHVNTILNWASFIPYVTPILFAEKHTEVALINLAEGSGWRIRNVSMWNRGIPILKYMFLEVMRCYSSPFYGYANADILFDRSLITNLKSFAAYARRMDMFVIGKRCNLNVSDPALRQMNASNLTMVAQLGRRNGSLFATNAQDYFLSTRYGFPWHRIPDLVVGRAGYDNWLVVKAQEWNLTVVDASYTIMAIHQTGIDGNRAGWAEQDQRCINREIIGIFNYTRGHTKCVPYISYVDLAGEIKIFRRPRIARDCNPNYRRRRHQPLRGCI